MVAPSRDAPMSVDCPVDKKRCSKGAHPPRGSATGLHWLTSRAWKAEAGPWMPTGRSDLDDSETAAGGPVLCLRSWPWLSRRPGCCGCAPSYVDPR